MNNKECKKKKQPYTSRLIISSNMDSLRGSPF